MRSKLFLIVFLIVIVNIVVIKAAPRAIKNEDDLKRSVIDFLSQDKEFLSALEHSGLVDNRPLGLLREKRQSETEMDIDDGVEEAPAEKDGFFDRAAKFVVDLLQRFLKWINSSEN